MLCGIYGPGMEQTVSRLVIRRGLYPLVDADACSKRGLDMLECARAIGESGVPLFQLRAKGRPSGEVASLAEAIVDGLSVGGPALIINDRADIAASVGAAGVHVGQDDLPARELSQKYRGLAVGLSTHDERQLEAALGLGALTYVALGPIFPTSSKKNPEPHLSLERLEAASLLARRSGVPLVAIGGVTEERLESCALHCELVAAIGLILPEVGSVRPYSTVSERCRKFDALVSSARSRAARG